MTTATHASRIHALLSEASQCLASDQSAKAIKLSEQAVAVAPSSADAHMVLADALAAGGEPERAREHYEKATQSERYHFGAWLNYGVFLKEIQDFKNAVLAFKNAVMIDPKSSLARYNLARALLDAKEYGESAEAFKVFVKMEPNFADGFHILSVTQELMGDYDEALKSSETAQKLDPKLARAYFQMGAIYQIQGRFEEAAPCYRKGIELNPAGATGYEALARADSLGSEDEQREALASIQAALASEDTDMSARVHFLAAATNILDSLGNYDEAFEHLREGNSIRNAAIGTRFDARTEDWIIPKTQLPKEVFSSRPHTGNPTGQPVFIVGMPRSGTTLTEQIIASHPQAFGAGELGTVEKLVHEMRRKLGKAAAYPGCVAELSDAEVLRLSESYLAGYPIDAAEYDRVTDKLPTNFVHLGLISLMFPNSKIIYSRRNAIDTCLSCYMQNFSQDIWYAFDLEKVAYHYRLHVELMDHWREVLPLQIHEVQYEDLTRDPEPNIRKLIDFCELEWDDACLNFHETERAIRTASIWQVRQPMYQTSVAKWKKYEKHLGPLIEGLGDLAHS